jgi:predicted metal-dependent hydrolase
MADILQFHWSDPKPLEVQVRPSPLAKYMRLKVLPSGQVEVVIPLRFDRRRIPGFVEQNRAWIEQNVQRLRLESAIEPPLAPPAQINLLALDGVWDVVYRETGRGRAQCRERPDGSLLVHAAPDEWTDALNRWVARMGRVHLVPWLERVSIESELPYENVTIRGQKTRWGSCSVRKIINLNYRLLFLPPPLVRYLFVHELCHTVHMNHSARYWALVERKEPNYAALDSELRRAGNYVPRWARTE